MTRHKGSDDMTTKFTLSVLPETFAICKLDRDSSIPAWATSGMFVSITRTPDELSVVCPENVLPRNLPTEIVLERAWRCLKVEGPLDLSMTGVLSALSGALAHAGITIFAISTYDTDYLLVRAESLERAVRVLRIEEHTVTE